MLQIESACRVTIYTITKNLYSCSCYVIYVSAMVTETLSTRIDICVATINV